MTKVIQFLSKVKKLIRALTETEIKVIQREGPLIFLLSWVIVAIVIGFAFGRWLKYSFIDIKQLIHASCNKANLLRWINRQKASYG